jgi:hypothetical protein
MKREGGDTGQIIMPGVSEVDLCPSPSRTYSLSLGTGLKRPVVSAFLVVIYQHDFDSREGLLDVPEGKECSLRCGIGSSAQTQDSTGPLTKLAFNQVCLAQWESDGLKYRRSCVQSTERTCLFAFLEGERGLWGGEICTTGSSTSIRQHFVCQLIHHLRLSFTVRTVAFLRVVATIRRPSSNT